MKFKDIASQVATKDEGKSRLFAGEDELMPVVDVARIYHVAPDVVRDWCRRGVIPSVKVGRRIYVPRDMLAAQMQAAIEAK